MRRKDLTVHHYYLGLLLSLTLVFVVAPFFSIHAFPMRFLNLAVFATLLFGLLVMSRSFKLVVMAIFMALPLLLGTIFSFWETPPWYMQALSALSGVCFVGLIIWIMLRDMFHSTRVDVPIIVGAIALYMLLGLFWGFIYIIIEQILPGSFEFMPASDLHDQTPRLMYFSLVTLTTLGYGDIVPLTPPAQSMAMLEAVVGQIYLAVMVARLVGMHIIQTRE